MNEHELSLGLRAIHQERADVADVEVVQQEILATPIETMPHGQSWLSRVEQSGFTMFSALKFVTAGVIVALFGGFLLAGVLTAPQTDEMTPAAESLVPSELEILTPSTGTTEGLVADGEGVLWALERPGRLVRFDPDTGTTTAWTSAHDIAFVQTSSIAPSAEGGVWLAGPDAARLFDGERFTQVIDAPDALSLVTEADDASLWATTADDAVLHWDGSTWEHVVPVTRWQRDEVLTMVVDSTGRPWVGKTTCPLREDGCGGEVAVLDGSEWTRYDRTDAYPLGGVSRSIMATPDGSVWVASEGGLARFDGTAWTEVSRGSYGSLAASPDGTVWAGSDETGVSVWRPDGADWESLAGPEGLTEPLGYANVALIRDRVFLGTDAGTYQRAGDDWELVWEVAPTRPYASRILASDDELWVVDAQGIRHFQGGSWTDAQDWTTHQPDSAYDRSPHDVALGPDGTVWVAGPDGVAYRDEGRWEFVDDQQAGAIAVDATGTVWAARFLQAGGCRVWTLREEGRAWVREDIGGCPLEPAEGDYSLAVDGDGSIWLGATGGWLPGGLARYANGEWGAIGEVEGIDVAGGVVVGADPDGAVWALILKDIAEGENETWIVEGSLARFADGEVAQVLELPGSVESGWGGAALGADGRPWAMSERGPARFDGQTWQYPYEGAALPWTQVGAVAADGSVYVVGGGDIFRYPASSD